LVVDLNKILLQKLLEESLCFFQDWVLSSLPPKFWVRGERGEVTEAAKENNFILELHSFPQ